MRLLQWTVLVAVGLLAGASLLSVPADLLATEYVFSGAAFNIGGGGTLFGDFIIDSCGAVTCHVVSATFVTTAASPFVTNTYASSNFTAGYIASSLDFGPIGSFPNFLDIQVYVPFTLGSATHLVFATENQGSNVRSFIGDVSVAPVPEPTSAILLVIGLAALSWWRWKERLSRMPSPLRMNKLSGRSEGR